MNLKKWVYLFSAKKTDGDRTKKNLLGGKGANLAEMTSLGLAVPAGFTVSTEACLNYHENQDSLSETMREQIISAIRFIEEHTNKKFGDTKNPLLFSVRSGARISMPGMMDTVLNLGLNDDSVIGLANLTGNPRFAWDSYRRFVQMYANVVMGFNTSILEATLEELKDARDYREDTELTAEDWQELVTEFKKIILEESGHSFPTDPLEQLWLAVGAVFSSWNNSRAIKYREINGIPHNWGTAVNVQSMVFGNMGEDCATGVCFTRDPSTGAKKFFGEYLVNAQGEDVVAGIRTPAPINEDSKNHSNKKLKTLEEIMPAAFAELSDVYQKLERHYKDMQDIEFTIEKNHLYILQTRSGKRTGAAAIKIAVDLVDEGLLTKDEALLSINPDDLNQLLHPRLDPEAARKLLAKGLPASPGAGAGEICLTSEFANIQHEAGKKVILVRQETSPEDIAGMAAARGILTARGGMTSHAAVVARGMGKPCVAGCNSLNIDLKTKTLTIDGRAFKEGDTLTIDGGTGEVFSGIIPTIEAKISDDFSKYMGWADERRALQVRTNADNPLDSEVAVNFGAEGIGLCRTEHMFFDNERLLAVREMIFADNLGDRKKALDKILPHQMKDFIGIFRVMHDRPVNIRLLDPPLHEFLPHTTEEKEELADYLKMDFKSVENRADQLQEANPMLGHRGCRLGVTYPEIYRMQTRAIMQAAIAVNQEGINVIPEIMVPLISLHGELKLLKVEIEDEIQKVFKETGHKLAYQIGTMIELPRAALTAGAIAEDAEFFSFGTNDLTQTTFGLSRDDAGKFLPEYLSRGLLEVDPFVSIDRDGVGFLVNYACIASRKVNAKIKLGICGEHGGEPKSIEFCHQTGLNYVSCSPYRVPIARLAAAQAAILYP